MSELSPGRPATDDLLVRYLDGEASPTESVEVEHGPNEDRLEALRLAGGRFAEVISEIDVPALPPLRAARRRFSAAAAVASLAMAGALAAMPVTRSWIVERVARPFDRSADPSPVIEPDAGRATARVNWTKPELPVVIESRQAAGVLRVERGPAGEVSAVAAGAELILLPDRLVVRNTERDTSDVVLTVSPALERLIVRLDGERFEIDLSAGPPDPLALDLPGG